MSSNWQFRIVHHCEVHVQTSQLLCNEDAAWYDTCSATHWRCIHMITRWPCSLFSSRFTYALATL